MGQRIATNFTAAGTTQPEQKLERYWIDRTVGMSEVSTLIVAVELNKLDTSLADNLTAAHQLLEILTLY